MKVPPPPRAPLRAAVAARLFAHAAARLDGIEIVLPDGAYLRREAGAPRLEIRSPAFFHRLGRDGKIGFGEAYTAGEWMASDLAGVLTAFARRLTTLVPPRLQWIRRLYEQRQPAAEDNTPAGARRNIHRHYDLSNDLFALFLDDTMAYSCAVFNGPGRDLAAAQRRKYEWVLALAGIRPGMRLLEIGSGWGGLAVHAAREHGCRVTTATVSAEQAAAARGRALAAGVADRVDVRLADYRELEGRYDAIVSVEMLEAVGERWWPTFFAVCDRLLLPGGRVALQTITMPHERYLATRRSYTWMHKYIFPGGLIPSLPALERATASASRLRIVRGRDIGDHYATTLALWRERFLERLGEVRRLGFDDAF